MMELTCDLETIQSKAIPIKVCNILKQKFVINIVEKKQAFFQSFNIWYI